MNEFRVQKAFLLGGQSSAREFPVPNASDSGVVLALMFADDGTVLLKRFDPDGRP